MADRTLTAIADLSCPPEDDLVARAVEACVRVRGYAVELNRTAEQKLRGIREAGRLLVLVQRSDGGRPLKNASSDLTSYQIALQGAGISRQTAHAWRRVAEIPEQQFEQFIIDAPRAGCDLTIVDFLRWCTPKAKTESTARTVKLVLSEADYRTFEHQVGVLGAVYFTRTPVETVMAVLGRAYRDWLVAQTQREGSGADVVARVA